jgi:hypothetical protein
MFFPVPSEKYVKKQACRRKQYKDQKPGDGLFGIFSLQDNDYQRNDGVDDKKPKKPWIRCEEQQKTTSGT